uniref:Mechanosensitive ion channel MscS domain-containing protein n=1 Tax=Rhizophora mucronata TaxID=61149 RepID=A0A2P2MVD0_RHIMU
MEITTSETIAIFLTAAAFSFSNTLENIFEAAVFIFVVHPFDVGDRCVVDGIPLIVEDINILTTVF